VSVTPVAFVAVTVNVEDCPAVMDVGLAFTLTVGTVGAVTVTVVFAEALPPDPVAVAV
jgi:hypothetical protein